MGTGRAGISMDEGMGRGDWSEIDMAAILVHVWCGSFSMQRSARQVNCQAILGPF